MSSSSGQGIGVVLDAVNQTVAASAAGLPATPVTST